jgi:hypothetical protein
MSSFNRAAIHSVTVSVCVLTLCAQEGAILLEITTIEQNDFVCQELLIASGEVPITFYGKSTFSPGRGCIDLANQGEDEPS